MTTIWKINNHVFTLKEGKGNIILAAVDKNTKQAWETQEINEKVCILSFPSTYSKQIIYQYFACEHFKLKAPILFSLISI